MKLLKKLFNEIWRLFTLIGFMVRLCLQERIFVSFFVLSLMFISTINIVFSKPFQNILMHQMQELKYAFISWDELALQMGVSAASIFVVLVIGVCFLPIIKHAFTKDYLEVFLSKPVSLGTYILSMFWAFLLALFVLVAFWWLFVVLTIYLHSHVFIWYSYKSFLYLFAFGCISLASFMLFYSAFRSALASVFTLMLSFGSIIVTDNLMVAIVENKISGIWLKLFELSTLFFSSVSDWILLAFNTDAPVNTQQLLLKTITVVLLFILIGTINFRRHVHGVELH